MRSLFFWRKARNTAPTLPADTPAPQAIAGEAPLPPPVTPAAAPSAPAPAMRSVYALALDDERAADVHARPSASHMNLLLAASSEFAQIGTQPRYTPRRPSLLPQLMEAVSDEDVSLRALSRIVAQDPQLTGELLRTANSALYRVSTTPVESVERAATVLGTTGIRTLISAALVRPLATDVSGLGRFGDVAWEHSLYSASAGEAWAARSQDADPFAAHLLGLMHGLGTVAVYRVLTDLYAAQPGLTPDATVVAQALDTNAAVTAGRIATNWGLSDRTRQALEAQSSASPTGDATPLSRALQFGLLTGALTLLCKHRKLADDAGLEQIEAAGFPRAQISRIWDRMLRAYVHP